MKAKKKVKKTKKRYGIYFYVINSTERKAIRSDDYSKIYTTESAALRKIKEVNRPDMEYFVKEIA